MAFNINDILKGAGAILVVILIGMMVFGPMLKSLGVNFSTNNAVLVTFIGFALIMGVALTVYDLAVSGAAFSFSRLLPLLVLVLALFLTIKYGMSLVNMLSPSVASVFPIG